VGGSDQRRLCIELFDMQLRVRPRQRGAKPDKREQGIRADYRFIGIKSKDGAPAFFGLTETRYGHRIYGGIVLTGGR
jgi:hypothetical protein